MPIFSRKSPKDTNNPIESDDENVKIGDEIVPEKWIQKDNISGIPLGTCKSDRQLS